MARGGYQPPGKPAPTSGPGPFSQRTDGPGQPSRTLANAAYGEQSNFQDIQGGAAMADSAQQMPDIVPLGAPTQRPNEPVTAGSPSGPGVGPEAIGMGLSNKDQTQADVRQIAQYLPSLEKMANQSGVPTSFVRFVKYVREFGQ